MEVGKLGYTVGPAFAAVDRFADDSAVALGMRVMSRLVLDYLLRGAAVEAGGP